MNELVNEWVRKSENDFRSALHVFALKDEPNSDLVCFLTQQCIEKLMKGLLTSHRVPFPKTHDLVELWDLMRRLGLPFQLSREELHFLSEGAVEVRYPGVSASVEDAEEAIEICKRMRDQFIPLLKQS